MCLRDRGLRVLPSTGCLPPLASFGFTLLYRLEPPDQLSLLLPEHRKLYPNRLIALCEFQPLRGHREKIRPERLGLRGTLSDGQQVSNRDPKSRGEGGDFIQADRPLAALNFSDSGLVHGEAEPRHPLSKFTLCYLCCFTQSPEAFREQGLGFLRVWPRGSHLRVIHHEVSLYNLGGVALTIRIRHARQGHTGGGYGFYPRVG